MAATFSIGDLEVLVVSDGEAIFPGTGYFRNAETDWEQHKRWLDHEGNVVFPLGCFLVRSGDRRVLIDTGLGPIGNPTFHGGELLNELASADVRPGEIDTVFVTHLHLDHCGTVARKDGDVWTPTFPNATYRWTADEQSYWSGPLPPEQRKNQKLLDAVAPRWEPADGGASLAPGVDVMAMPGHTPGHAGVVLSSGDARAFLLGDAVSCPVQFEETEWSGLGDIDPGLARKTQEALAAEIEGKGALAGASHFPGLTFGRLLRGNGRRYWQPVKA
jgi:glyoxylase-like metal-dependent hydrolase (beta-lactamase superfamily II)